jgi:hypothetical protein
MTDDRTTIEAINETVEELRESLAERFDENPSGTLPLLSPPGTDPDPGWWVENVAPLQESIEASERKLDRATGVMRR